MKLLVFCPRDFGKLSGAEIALKATLEALAHKGWDIRVVCKEPHPKGHQESIHEGITVYHGRTPDVSEWLYSFKPDFVGGQLTWLHEPLTIARKRGVRTIGFVHMAGDLLEAAKHSQDIDLLVCNTKVFQSQAVGSYGKTILVHPPLGDKQRYIRGLQDTDGLTVGMVNLIEGKGVKLFHHLVGHFPTIKFLGIRGGYGAQQTLLDPPFNLTYLPPQERIASAFSKMDVLLVPSYNESYGMIAREALANGIPVIVSDLPGLREAVGQGKTLGAQLCKVNDQGAWTAALERVRGNFTQAQREALALAATWEGEEAEQLENLHQTMLELLKTSPFQARFQQAVRETQALRRRGHRNVARPNPVVSVTEMPGTRTFKQLRQPTGKTLSVLMACGPVHTWLREAVDSVLRQDLPEGWGIEVLLGVDGCQETLEVARTIQDPRFGIISLDGNHGTYVAFNTLRQYARGELISRCDADDVVLPGRLCHLIRLAESDPSLGMVNTYYSNACPDTLTILKQYNYPPEGCWTLRRWAWDKLGGFPPWKCGADTESKLRAEYMGIKHAVLPEYTYLARQHATQLTRSDETSGKSALRQQYISLINRDRALYAAGKSPEKVVPVVAPCSVEGPLFDDPVWVSLAAIPQRKKLLQQVVEGLLPQVNRLNVYLNGFGSVPKYLKHPKIVVARSQVHGDRGDAGKMFWVEECPGYYLSVDDDILYPPDYVEKMVGAIKARGNKVVMGVHGVVLKPDFHDYVKDRTVFRFQEPLEYDKPCHLVGTGTAAWHVRGIQVTKADFPVPNMADIWLARLGQQQKVPFVTLARPKKWLVDLGGYTGSIFDQSEKRTGTAQDVRTKETEVCLGLVPWKLNQER